MKKILMIFPLASLLFASCKKGNEGPSNTPSTGLYVINAVIGSSPLIIRNANVEFIFSNVSSAQQISYGTSKTFGPAPGTYNYQFIQASDTLHTLVSSSQTFQPGQLYSLFLTGNTSQPDQFLIHDAIFNHTVSDSTGGLRFVNLSPGSSPISVNIAGQSNGSEAQNLNYKSITSFKNYPATYKVITYKFEFRDQITGNLIASYSFTGINNGSGTNTAANTFRYMNMTLALIGQPGNTSAPQKIILINNF